MLSKRVGIVLALAFAPALAQIPSQQVPSQIASSPTGSVIPRQHDPRHRYGTAPRVIDNVTVEDSTNWSGYAVEGTGFTKALGSWIVPSVNCTTTPNTYSSFWVGIDGWTSSTVEQTGTDSDCSGRTPSYYAWYEFYPAASVLISSVPISPGNHVSATVTWNSGSSFTLTLTNQTTGKTFTKTGTVSGAARTSAEWIAEAPCCTRRGGILPLADFGTVDFGQDFTGIASTNDANSTSVSGAIGAYGSNVFESIMVNGSTGANEAVPSALSSDGTSFTVTWDSE